MKKKLFAGIAAGLIAAAMCVSFAACGTDAKKIKGYEVTEDQWKAAVEALEKDDAQYTLNVLEKEVYEMEMDLSALPGGSKMSGGSEKTTTITQIKNGNLQYSKESYKIKFSGDGEKMAKEELDEGEELKYEGEEETYAEYKDNVWTTYEQDKDGNWKKAEYGHSVVMSSWAYYKDMYNAFEYSTEHKGYVQKTQSEGGMLLVIKFDKKANLVAFYVEMKNEEGEKGSGYYMKGSMEEHVVISYKAKSITLPTVA